MCASGPVRAPADAMERYGLEPPVSEWQGTSAAGLVLVQQFAKVADLHDAPVVVTAAGFADSPVLNLGDGLVLGANNQTDTRISIDDELSWLNHASEVAGGPITLTKSL